MTGAAYYNDTLAGNIVYLQERAVEAGLRLRRDPKLLAWVITPAEAAHGEAVLVTGDINYVSYFLDGVRFADRRREGATERTAGRTP